LAASKSENEALSILDEVMLRPRTIADTLPGIEPSTVTSRTTGPTAEYAASLADDLSPKRIEELRADKNGDLGETVARDFDRLLVDRSGMDVPIGETIDASGQRVAVTRKIEDIASEVERREAAAKEIAACVGPYPEE
jgi:hypothetical protein